MRQFFSSIRKCFTIQTQQNQRYRTFFIAKISNREKIIKALNKYITTINHAENALLVLSRASSVVSLYSLTTYIDSPFEIASGSICLVFLISNGIVKIFPKIIGRKKIALLVRSKLLTGNKTMSGQKGNQLGNIEWYRLMEHDKTIGQNEIQTIKSKIKV